jgi:hypothetical protein
MISIGVVDEHSFTRECITRSLKEFGDSLDIVSFITCDDLLRSFRALDLILYHVHQSIAHTVMIDELRPLKNCRKSLRFADSDEVAR